MSLSYQTARLQVSELLTSKQDTDFLVSMMGLLTVNVVENLPPSFHHINCTSSVQIWLDKLTADGRLMITKLKGECEPIGLVFLSAESIDTMHIGYLLGEAYWGNGYATEILSGLLDFIESEGRITHLIAGVASDNLASMALLKKLGFSNRSSEENGTLFFEYRVSSRGSVA